jgi:hypothetical protein
VVFTPEVYVGISFTTSVISTIGGKVKFISKIEVFMCSPTYRDQQSYGSRSQ